MMALLFRQEYTRLFRRSPARLALVLIYVVLAIWAGLDGLYWKHELSQAQAHRPVDLKHERGAWTEELKNIESGKKGTPYQARPMNLTLLAVLPPGPLAQLSHRGEAIHPHTAVINGWKNDGSLFRRYEIEGPSALAMRGVDLSFLAIVFFPLVILLSTFDALSAERQSGRLRLLMVQGLEPVQLLWARILAIVLPLWLITAAIAIGVSLAFGGGGNMPRLLLWLAAYSAYTVLWATAAAWIATRWSRSSDAAMAAMGIWIVLVLLVPSFVQFAAEAVYPTPSRVVYLTEAREAEALARREIERRAEVYMAEHDIEADGENESVPKFFRSSFIANANINAKTAPLVERLEQQRKAQVAVANRIEFLAPTMLAYRLLQHAAGVGNERAADYRRQVRVHLKELHDVIGPVTVAKRRLSLEEAAKIPDFEFEEAPVSVRSWLGVLWLSILAAVIAVFSLRRVRELRPTDDND